MKVLRIAVFICLLLQVVPVPLQAQKSDIDKLHGAAWIAAKDYQVIADSLMYGDHPAPLFRKDFTLIGKLKNATLTITAAGYYLASINGKAVQNNVLDPAWTNFSKRIYYSTYDVTSLLRSGANTIGIELGNGFYNLLPLKMFGRNLRTFLPTGEPQFIAILQFTYADGTTQSIVTDTNWKTADGPLMKNNVYLGVHYDARKEIKGWNLPGFDDRLWNHPVKMNGPGGELLQSFFPAVKVTKQIHPVDIRSVGKTTIVDIGTNLTGLYKIKLTGEPGDTIRFRFGERLYENGTLNPMTTVAGQVKQKGRGGPGAPDIAWQTDSYVFGAEKTSTWQPQFSFHTFRYMEITGLKYLPQKEDIEAQFFHSDVENQNRFTCSSPILNDIQKICRQTFLSNLITVQSDCPAREKFGYGGDLNATSETFMYNFDMQSFYRKTVYDWVDAMQDSIFIDTAPYVGIKYCGISWESAFLTTQYKLFQYYGDTAIVNELYLKDLEWMDKVKRLHPNGIVDKGLSDHESMVKVPVQLIGTTHYLDCARIMQRFAEIRRDNANIKKFAELEKILTRKLLDQFWYQPVPDPINRQTLFSTLIYYRIIPPKEIPAVTDSLLKAVHSAPAGHFTTGIFGTKYILEALSMTGHADEVFKIVNSAVYPGWGFMISKGATTLWETWKESDNTYSNCHPMFGTVSEWYFRWLAGIRPLDESPGFKKFLVAPVFPEGLNHAEAVYHAPAGDIKVVWNRDDKGGIMMMLTVPTGTTALFKPSENARKQWKVTNVNTKISIETHPESSWTVLREGIYLIKER
ncbi:MAG: family 78 glycoside hydrolase catalytic domain [Bacteroidia bacterium]|nr:family 78 glycoside hydrolase catalytic domain [Bacteroidia bacterium]